MVNTRTRKAEQRKKDQALPKKQEKVIKKPEKKKPPVRGAAPRATRRSTRVAKQFVPFDNSAAKEKLKNARVAAKSIRRRAVSVQRARSVHRDRKRALPKEKKKPAGKVVKDRNDKLTRREFIDYLKVHPFLFGPAGKVNQKVVSTSESIRLAIRYVLQKDVKALQKLVNDRKRFPSDGLAHGYAFEDCMVPETLAALTEDRKVLEAVLQLQKKLSEETQSERASRPVIGTTLLEKMSSGVRNFYMLGHATRAIEMTRGGREGNNALVNYDPRKEERDVHKDARRLMERDISFATLEHLVSSADSSLCAHHFTNKIVNAVRFGNRKLAGKVAETYNSYSFNQLQIQTLLNNKEPLKKFMPIATTKKAVDNARITPFHTAAINPNVAYLKELVTVNSNFNVPDSDNWYTVHYASVCEGSGPLEYLLKKETPILLTNKRKETPLHTAASAGRVQNLKILVNALKNKKSVEEKAEEPQEEDGPPPAKKTKSKEEKDPVATQLNAKDRQGYSPLHLAVCRDRLEVVRFLLQQPGVDVEAQCGAAKGKQTPLMMACRRGNLDIANLLIEEGRSFIDKKDKLHRTALTHAAMNGQTHVVAMLLRRGADVAASTDSSGNSAVHYACAYGWLDVLELLAKADSEALTSPNAWHLTPLSVAYLKGHFNIVDYLLNGEFKDRVNVNGKDNNGSTLISAVVGSYEEISDVAVKEQVDYLIERGADSSIVDSYLRTPLHIVAGTRAVLRSSQATEKVLSSEEYLRLVDSLITSGAEVLAKDNDGDTALQKALKTGNLILASHLFEKEPAESTKCLFPGEDLQVNTTNVFHLLASLPSKVFSEWKCPEMPSPAFFDVLPFFEKLCKQASPSSVVSSLEGVDEEGLIPIVLLSRKIASFYDSIKFDGDERERAAKKETAAKVLKTMCELAERFIELSPETMLSRCEMQKKKGEDNGGNRSRGNGSRRGQEEKKKVFTCIGSALRMKVPAESPIAEEFRLNGRLFTLRNPLLMVLLEKATQHDLLKTLLTTKSGKLTPLLFAIAHNRDEEARYIMHYAEKNGLLNTILKDRFVKKVENNGKDDEWYECSALMLAAMQDLNDLLDGFSPAEAIARDEDSFGNSVMHIFAKKATMEALRHLKRFSEGGVPMKANHDGRHPIHIAVDHQKASDTDVSTDVIDWIVEQEPAAARLQDCHGRTALHYAFVEKMAKDAKSFRVGQEGTKRDPIAVVSVLLKCLDKKTINVADNFGNTALHYAAFFGSTICCGVLLSKGADSEALNTQGNSALCLAVLKEHEHVTLTLIQAKSDVCRQVFKDEVTQSDEEQLEQLWTWLPNRVIPNKTLQNSIASLVVRNGWQGIIYVILDLLSKSPSTLLDLITAAVEHRKYNLLNMLLKLLRRQKTKDLASSDVVSHFFENLQGFTSGLNEQESAVLHLLILTGFPLEARSLITVAAHGGVDILDELVEKHEAKKFLEKSDTVEEVLVGLIRSWPTVEPSRMDKLKKWIEICLKKVPVDSELEFPKPAFDGMEKFRDAGLKHKTTPLIWAIQQGDVSLVRYLLVELKADVNKADAEGRTPLMIAVMWNLPKVVETIFDPTGVAKPVASGSPQKKKAHAGYTGFRAIVNGNRSSSESEEVDVLEEMEREIQAEESQQNGEAESTKKKEQLRLTNTDLDLSKTDSSDRTFVHYFVEPNGWQNVSLLEEVCAAAPVVKNLLKRPLDRAMELGQEKIAPVMAKIAKISLSHWTGLPSGKVALPEHCNLNVAVDSDAFLREKKSSKPAEKKPPKPNENSGYAESGDLVECEENGSLFRVLLNKSDVQYGTYGYHNFYRMEIIRRRGSSLFILFTNWGRIGDDVGQFQRTPFNSLPEAAKEFASIFRQKTGNEWAKLPTFDDKPGKYHLVQIEDEEDVDLTDIEMKLEIKEERVKEEPIYRILTDMSDVVSLQARCRSLKYDYNKTMSVSFGKIDRQKIVKASRILDELRDLCDDLEKLRKEGGKNIDRILRLLKEQAQLSNEFYKNMPLEGFTHCRLPVIDTADFIKRSQRCLEQLFEFDTAGSLITAAITAQSRGTDPIDYISKALECRLQLLDPESSEAQRILQTIQNSSSAQVTAIFSVLSRVPADTFANCKLKDRKYLWHGTKPENLLSILKHGLKASPSSATQSGQLFGEGIYFADAFAKSERYCTSSRTGSKYALLCEVALGRVSSHTNFYSCNDIKETRRINTVYVYGYNRPNPAYDLTLENGVTLPIGSVSKLNTVTLDGQEQYTQMEYSEYVVKENTNTLVRYLVVFN